MKIRTFSSDTYMIIANTAFVHEIMDSDSEWKIRGISGICSCNVKAFASEYLRNHVKLGFGKIC